MHVHMKDGDRVPFGMIELWNGFATRFRDGFKLYSAGGALTKRLEIENSRVAIFPLVRAARIFRVRPAVNPDTLSLLSRRKWGVRSNQIWAEWSEKRFGDYNSRRASQFIGYSSTFWSCTSLEALSPSFICIKRQRLQFLWRTSCGYLAGSLRLLHCS